MERETYDWKGKRKPYRDSEGHVMPMKSQILTDCGLSVKYPSARERIWEHPDFLALVAEERDRRDHGIVQAVSGPVGELEAAVQELTVWRHDIQSNVISIFEKGPNADDPECLSPKEYVHEGLSYMRYIDEMTGRTKSQEQQGIDAVVSALAEQGKITSAIANHAMDVLSKIREKQDSELRRAGLLMEAQE
jgi:hypothetical protein